jgi:predicted HAD superfamily Cof-like phosphohydrolase
MSIKQTLDWFKAAVPTPDNRTLSVQVGCHLEEVAEMLEAITTSSYDTDETLDEAFRPLNIASGALKSGEARIECVDRTELLDSLCDQIVTAVGIAHMMGMDIEGALVEVNRANFSKFENGQPVFLEGGKIGKGADYLAPDLSRFVGGDV